eukprot:GILK01001975.1.p1 GENE.GILK01001975.1~~GILK01001975.1.p1  ORF type:complete len:405 (+),score=90.28 GILK01001975.1:40-1215(+)
MGNKAGKEEGGEKHAEAGAAAADINIFLPPTKEKVTLEDFKLEKVLGKGSFGKVMLVRKTSNNELYAMKILRKADVLARNQIAHTQTERRILEINHPFMVNLHYAFQTADKLYLVVDYLNGGELFFHLSQKKRFSENQSRLYTAEILLALEHMHSFNVIYRDLKPENIMLTLDGHVKITDFGLSKEGVQNAGGQEQGGTKTFCGTPEYLAPEILRQIPHGKAVDWWSLGVLLYEMLCGRPPFYDQNRKRMYEKILHSEVFYPPFLSANAKSILQGLLTREVSTRLGSGPTDAAEIKAHPFFSSLNWEDVYQRRIRPEYTPTQLVGSLDVSNFDKEFTREPAVDSVVTTTLSSTAVAKTTFDQFTYTGAEESHLAGGNGSHPSRIEEEVEEK